MKVLVTGGCGFLGSHLCGHYAKKGWEVIAYDNLTKFEFSRVPYFNVDAIRKYVPSYLESLGVKVVKEDIRDSTSLALASKGCNFVVHTASQPAMTIALENPIFDFEVNTQGTLNVLEVCNYYKIPMVNCSTIHVYGNGINGYLTEDLDKLVLEYYPGALVGEIGESAPLLTGKITPLHASKRTAEIYTQAYVDSYGLRAASFRLTGMYGPRQFGGEDHGWVANFAIRSILGLPIKIFGTDKQVRDILYIDDAVMAFDEWFEAGCPSGIYNIGGGTPCLTSLGDCLNIIKVVTGKKQGIELLPKRQGDLWYFCCDTLLAKTSFNWSPKVPPKEGIPNLVDWVEENRNLFKEEK